MNETKEEYRYCSPQWTTFWEPFHDLSFFFVLFISAIGVITNSLNIWVLTRKQMMNPTNVILVALGLADFADSLRTLVLHGITLYISSHSEWHPPFQIVVEDVIARIFHILFHSLSIYLTLLTALWRYLAVVHPLQSRRWCTLRAVKAAILCVVILCSLLVLAAFGSGTINIHPGDTNYSGKPDDYEHFPKDMYGWSHGLFIKLLPCIAMTLLSMRIFASLVLVKKKRRELTNTNAKNLTDTSTSQNVEEEKEFNRITRMLLTILIVFLVSEFPSGIFSSTNLLTFENRSNFYRQCYDPVKSILTVAEVFAASYTFFIYIAMSHKFRSQVIFIITGAKDSPGESNGLVTIEVPL